MARMLSRKRLSIQDFVAVNDTIGKSATPAELMKKYGIDCDAVIAAVKRIMER